MPVEIFFIAVTVSYNSCLQKTGSSNGLKYSDICFVHLQYTLAACNQASCLRNFFSLLQLICSFIGVVLPMSWFCRLVFFFVLILLLFFYTFLPQAPGLHPARQCTRLPYTKCWCILSASNMQWCYLSLLGHLFCFLAKHCPSGVSHGMLFKSRGTCQFTASTRKLNSSTGDFSKSTVKASLQAGRMRQRLRCSCANACTQNKCHSHVPVQLEWPK